MGGEIKGTPGLQPGYTTREVLGNLQLDASEPGRVASGPCRRAPRF